MKLHQNIQGFTIVEALVSMALFAVIVTMSVGTLLVLIDGNQKTQNESSSLSNIMFALDSMTREIRTGADYYCPPGPITAGSGATKFSDQESFVDGRDCSGSANNVGLSFVESGSSVTGAGATRIAYYIQNNALWRSVGNGGVQRLTSPEVVVHEAEFIVTETRRLTSGNENQPMVTISIVVSAAKDAVSSCTPTNAACLYVQTTVNQRLLDI